MHKSNDALARKMTAFCKEQSGKRPARPKRPPTASAMLGVVVAALLAPRCSRPCWHH
ncbi:MAG: hypothetical protein SXV54_06105 [Chloroflexota bacterium]|nr:hypothetical protein [Chloroflexota bacterium]